MNKTFIKGALYQSPGRKSILRFVAMAPYNNARFEYVAGKTLMAYEGEEFAGTVGYGGLYRFEDFRRAYHWSDLPTPADKKAAALKVDPLNGKFEDEILRHYAAKRARLLNLMPVLGGEYYAKP